MPEFGVYPAADALAAGEEISSTYEGRHVTLTAAELLTSDGSGVATKGLPCIFGLTGLTGVGVCFKTGTTTDLIPIDTEGIWNLDVEAADDDGNVAVAGGDEIYINKTTGILSKIANKQSNQRFGYALGIITSGNTERIAVKVHWNPDDATELVGTSAVPLSSATQNSFREYRYRTTKTSGDVRGEYIALGLNGVGVSGEAGRHRTIVEAVGVLTAHGAHDGLEFDADGTLSGLGVGHRATFMGPNRALFATIAGGMSELWAEGASTDFGTASVHSIHRFVMAGEGTGKATADNVFEFVGLSAVQYANNTDTPVKALRVIINGVVRYIMVSEAQA